MMRSYFGGGSLFSTCVRKVVQLPEKNLHLASFESRGGPVAFLFGGGQPSFSPSSSPSPAPPSSSSPLSSSSSSSSQFSSTLGSVSRSITVLL
uniref:Uncharacterized protein n=1 Tax=Anguilla anguilla TaxID=7936 RepID=A0A0E9SDQ9_ANGAN